MGGSYLLLREIGRGAMGVVMLAWDQRLERRVAVKLVREDAIQPGFLGLFLREAQAMARVNHPNVLCIHALGEHGSVPYFVTEHVEGKTLEQWLRAQVEPPRVEVALDILTAVCDGVSAIHRAGTVHRDLKPSNILLDDNLRARVADFGVSSRFRGHGSGPQEMAGTPAYMAPEVALSAGDPGTPSPASDVYSLGCIAFELLTGQRPVRSRGSSELGVSYGPEPIAVPSEVRPDLPRAFDRVLLQALASSPAERTRSADDFRRALLDAAQQGQSPERILLAEDDDDFRELLRVALGREFPSAEVECVADGVAALEAFHRKAPSIALIDLQMPALDGVSVTKTLRDLEAAKHMPIVVLTGLGGAEEWKRLAQMGADGFLVKPFHMDDLVTLVRRSLRERAAPSVRPASGHVPC
jgi:serine/threonine-protein kinase